MKRLFVSLLVLIILVNGALAAQEETSETATSKKEKSESLALTLSLTGTIVPWVLLFSGPGRYNPVTSFWLPIGGTIIGPSLGYFYGGLPGRALRGIGIRSLAHVAWIAAFVMAWNNNSDVGTVLFLGGAAGLIYSSIADIVKVQRAVRKRNEELKSVSIAMAPIFNPREKLYGVGIRLTF